MDQIEFFIYLLRIIIGYWKSYSYEQFINITLEYWINWITNDEYQFLKPFDCVQTNDQYLRKGSILEII